MENAKLSIVGVCLMVIGFIAILITGNNRFIISVWSGLIFVMIDLFTD